MVILTNPDYNGIISNTVISLNTRKNLVIINKILKKISRASFFDGVYESNYTLFNTYLIEIMPMINNFFKKLTDVKLPIIIEDLIEKKIENLQMVDYFRNNQDELINLQAISFSISDVFIFYQTVKNNLELFSQDTSLKKSLEKIEIKENFLQKKLKDHSNKNVKKYYIIYRLINNPSKVELLYPVQNRFTFNINQKEENYDFTVNRIKFCVKTILRNLNGINSTIYSHLSEAETTEKLFLALNKIIELEDFADNLTNDKIPLSWYSLYLTSNLSQLQNYYLNSKDKDDFKSLSLFHPNSNLSRLYEELYQETRKDIDTLNYKSNLVITKYGMNLCCAEKLNEILKKEVLKVKQIEKFVRIEKFIQNGKISVCIRSKNSGHMNVHTKDEDHNNSKDSNSSNKSSSIIISKQEQCVHIKYNFLDKAIDGKPERKNIINTSKDSFGSSGTVININFGNKNLQGTPLIDKLESHCESIEEFINTFQQFNEIVEDIVFGDQRNKIYDTLENYLNIVKEQLEKDELFSNIYNSETISEVIEDIENYLIKKMYKNTFPENELPRDILFHEQCLKFNWITPYHLEINDKFINENLWQSAIAFIKRMDSEKSPVEKLKCVHSAYKILNNCISFCTGKQEFAGLDDIFPIFIYILIKSEPKRMFSNMQYIKTFMSPGRLLANYGFLLTQIEGSVNFILEINQNMLKISEEEYQK